MSREWPATLPVAQLRIARPTSRLTGINSFYREGLGLPIIFSYEDDADYDGIMFGLPSRDYHLEFTRHRGDGPCPIPSPDTLLVFYLPDKATILETVSRLERLGYHPVPPRNPYWAVNGVTIADPD